MNTKKIIMISLVCIVVMAIMTVVIAQIKPQMHKTIMFEQIIFKRSTAK